MSKLIVRPIDLNEAGSYRDRARLFEAVSRLEGIQASGNPGDVVAAFKSLETLILPRLRSDDDTPVEELLDRISANEFDGLLGAIMGPATTAETIPPEIASS